MMDDNTLGLIAQQISAHLWTAQDLRAWAKQPATDRSTGDAAAKIFWLNFDILARERDKRATAERERLEEEANAAKWRADAMVLNLWRDRFSKTLMSELAGNIPIRVLNRLMRGVQVRTDWWDTETKRSRPIAPRIQSEEAFTADMRSRADGDVLLDCRAWLQSVAGDRGRLKLVWGCGGPVSADAIQAAAKKAVAEDSDGDVA